MALSLAQSTTRLSCKAPAPSKAAVTVPARSLRCSAVPLELLAKAGDVDAPIAVPIVAAAVVTIAITFAVPAYLNRGQQAADQIFASKQQKPLDKKTTGGKKTTSSKRR